MTSHELARKLLGMPVRPVLIRDAHGRFASVDSVTCGEFGDWPGKSIALDYDPAWVDDRPIPTRPDPGITENGRRLPSR